MKKGQHHPSQGLTPNPELSLHALAQSVPSKNPRQSVIQTPPGYKQTEVGVIPEDWEIAQIRDVASVKTGPFGSSLHERDYVQDGTPIITVEHLDEFGVMHSNLPMVSDADRQRLKAYSLEENDIVFSRVGSIDRNSLIRSKEAGWLFSGRLLRIRPNDKKAFPPYLSYHFHDEPFKQRVRSVAVGQTMPSLNTQIINGIYVVLPPLPEQRAIAAALSDVDSLITALDRLIAKKRAIKQAAMQQLLTGKKRLPGFDGAWEVKRLGEMAELKNGYAFKSSTYSAAGDFKIITIGNVQDGYLDTKECNRIAAIPHDIQPHQLLRRGDHLISMTGNVGRVCCVDEDNCLLNQRVGKLIPTSADQTFFYHLTRQGRFISSMILKAKGGAQGNLGVSDITHFEFPVPVASAEQQAIAAVLSDMDAEIAALEQKRDKTRALKQGLMQELLTGRTRLL